MAIEITYGEREQTEAASLVRAYRASHAIDPEYPATSRYGNWCRSCGIAVYPIKGGWRHDISQVERLIGIAGTAR